MNPKSLCTETVHPWQPAHYLVYAQNLHVARLVNDYARSQSAPLPFGTSEPETGETIDWINMRYGVVRQAQSE